MKKLGSALSLVAGLMAMAATAQAADMAISVEAGTTGIGTHLSIPLQKNLNARFGVNYLNYDFSDSTSTVDYDFRMKLQTLDALLDWFPMQDSGFRVSGGLVYNGNKIRATARPTAGGTYTLNGTTYAAATAGTLDGSIDFRKVAPYLGVGWGNALAKQSGGWAFQAELGAMFQGSPRSNLVNTGCTAPTAVCTQLAADVAAENANLRNDVRSFRAYPVIRLGVSYRF